MKRSSEATTTIKPYVSKRCRRPNTTSDGSGGGILRVDCDGGPSNGGPCDSKEEPSISTTRGKSYPMKKFFPRSKIPNRETFRCQGHQKAVTSIQWSPCRENLLLTSSLDKDIKLWNYHEEKLSNERSINIHSEGVKDARWSADGTTILTASFDKTVKVVDSETGTCKHSYVHNNDMVTSAIFHGSEEQLFLTGTFSNGIFAWDLRQSKPVKHFKSFFGQVQDLLFLPDNETFLSSAESAKRNSLDKIIIAWDFKTTAVMSNQIYQEPFTCTCLRLHPSNNSFLAQSAAGYIVLFNSEKPWKMNKYKRFQGHMAGGYHVGFDITSDGTRLYSGDTNGCFFAYDYHTSNVLKKHKLFTSPCVAVACSPYSTSTTCFASWDGTVALWE